MDTKQNKDSRALVLDGSLGEGGGQILRTSLTLAAVTGQSVWLKKIRAGRKKPGLLRQHLTAAHAAAAFCGATVEGAELGSGELRFVPGPIRSRDYSIAIGTAGSTTLVLQTVLPILCRAGGPSSIRVEGGTHNPWSPPLEFLRDAFLPILRRMGVQASLSLHRAGFYPAGGGEVTLEVKPASELTPVSLLERGAIQQRRAVATVAGLSRSIAARELVQVQRRLGLQDEEMAVEELEGTDSPGNVVQVTLRSESVTEVFTGFGRFGVPAKRVASEVTGEVRDYLVAGVPVGRHLADQLLLPFALAGAGEFRTFRPTLHTQTNMQVIERFLPIRFEQLEREQGVVDIRVVQKGDAS